jgi:serine/threonine protein kinase
MSLPDCPSREELFDYAVGRLSDDASDVLASHLDACSTCQTTLATLHDANDSLVARLRAPVSDDPLLAEPECGVALARAKAVGGRPAEYSSRSAVMPLPVPGQFDEYQLLEELGHGGMGTVYKALHTKLDRVVAVKVLAKSRVEDERAIARFEREMKAIGRLDHPQIVRAHDAREIDGRPVLIMEYVEGLDLARLVERAGRLRVPDACELVRRVAVGLQYVHEHDLVHRDIKPSNLMLTPRGEIKILDLGLARFHREQGGSDEMTGTGQTLGTADYMAPEQTSHSHGADIRADIYSLGCTLFKLLSGHAPFDGPDFRGTFDKMTAHVQTPAPSIREVVASVPEELAVLLGRMLAKDPAQRPATPADVAQGLEPFCAGHDLPGLASSRIGFQPVNGVIEGGPIHTSPKRKRGNDLASSLALRAGINFSRARDEAHPTTCLFAG